jgi:hypothetical protein
MRSISEIQHMLALAFFLLCEKCFCTTVVFITGPTQIVAGSDRLGTTLGNGRAVSNPTTATKIVLLKGRFIVASVGVIHAETNKKTTYDFAQWIRGVESQVSADTSILGLVGIIESESSRTFKTVVPIEDDMRRGAIPQSDSLDKFLVHYVIAAFDNGVPTIIQVYYELDWDSKSLLGPKRKVEVMRAPGGDGHGTDFMGRNCAIQEIDDPDSYAHKRMNILCPSAFKKVLDGKDISVADGIRAARGLISIQTEVEPSFVGRGARVIVLPIKGDGIIREYESVLSPEHPVRPKNKSEPKLTHYLLSLHNICYRKLGKDTAP